MDRVADGRLTEIFSSLNMSDFPALKEHVRALQKLANSPHSAMQEVLAVCQKDYGLAVKLLREANSAFYAHTRAVCSVAGAAGRLGQSAIYSQVNSIPVLEDVARMVGEAEMTPLISKSYLSACLARSIAAAKKLSFHPDDAFACSLLHRMGKIAALVFLPERYRKVTTLCRDGLSEEEAARQIYYGLTFAQLGMELSRFWNLADLITLSMDPSPPPPKGRNDAEGIMQVLACFCNRLVEAVCEDGRTNILFDRYGKVLSLAKEEALPIFEAALEEAKSSGKTYRQCLLGYKLSGKIKRMEGRVSGSIRKEVRSEEAAAGPKHVAGEAADSPVKKFFVAINKALKEHVEFGAFAGIILDALCKGVGLDRVLLVSLVNDSHDMYLKGRFGAGDIQPGEVRAFRYSLSDPGDIFTECLSWRRDANLTVDWQTNMAPKVKELYFGRYLYLLLLYVNEAPVGLLVLDRKPGRLPLTDAQLSAASAFRDLLIMGIRKDMAGFLG